MTAYCTKRFDKLKHLFCESLGIPLVSSEDTIDEKSNGLIIVPTKAEKPEKKYSTRFSDKCIKRLADIVGEDLIKLRRGSFRTGSNEFGFAVTTSKEYKQGTREKYWFAYRRAETIANCKEQFYVFGCKDDTTMIKLPVSLLEDHLDRLNSSVDEDGNITHWHIVFFKDSSGHMTWLLSKPKLEEISIDGYQM